MIGPTEPTSLSPLRYITEHQSRCQQGKLHWIISNAYYCHCLNADMNGIFSYCSDSLAEVSTCLNTRWLIPKPEQNEVWKLSKGCLLKNVVLYPLKQHLGIPNNSEPLPGMPQRINILIICLHFCPLKLYELIRSDLWKLRSSGWGHVNLNQNLFAEKRLRERSVGKWLLSPS